MKQRWIWVLALLGCGITTSLIVLGLSTNASAQEQARTPGNQTLINASSAEIEAAAQQYTNTRFEVLSGTPEVLLMRSVTAKELPELGLPSILVTEAEPPLQLVVLKGDFDVRNLRRSAPLDEAFRVHYITYVFDLQAGGPALISVSRDGSRFRTLLNDSSLPKPAADPAANQRQPYEVAPPEPLSDTSIDLPYGATAPEAVPPSDMPPIEP